MLNSEDIEYIINDITGTIILVVEDEGSFNVNINDFFIDNFNMFTKGNYINTTLEECKNKIDLSQVIKDLIIYGFSVVDEKSGERLYTKDINLKDTDLKKFIDRNLIIKECK